jgi:hypothetical protein
VIQAGAPAARTAPPAAAPDASSGGGPGKAILAVFGLLFLICAGGGVAGGAWYALRGGGAEAPEPAEAWDGVRDATRPGATPQRGDTGVTIIPEPSIPGLRESLPTHQSRYRTNRGVCKWPAERSRKLAQYPQWVAISLGAER